VSQVRHYNAHETTREEHSVDFSQKSFSVEKIQMLKNMRAKTGLDRVGTKWQRFSKVNVMDASKNARSVLRISLFIEHPQRVKKSGQERDSRDKKMRGDITIIPPLKHLVKTAEI
jgi:hypothetical protein